MGKRGPPPTPTAVLKIRGSWRAKTRKGEPEPKAGRPETPAGFTDAVLKVWKTLVEMLELQGTLAVCDGGQLERYCRYFVRWRQIDAEIQQVATAGSWKALGSDKLRPVIRGLWNESHRLDMALKQVEREFHLTPSARARVGLMNALGEVVAGKDDKGKKRFFAG